MISSTGRTRALLASLLLTACADDPTAPLSGEATANAFEIVDLPDELRQGDVVALGVYATDAQGVEIDAAVTWSLLPADAGHVTGEGRFVGYQPGEVRVIARRTGSGEERADTAAVTITSRGLSGSFSVVGRGVMTAVFTSDLWLFGDYAYTGSIGTRTTNGVARRGNTMYVWRITDPANPVITDSIIVDATTVNDVKISADGHLAVITHEGSSDQRGGITLLDLADPAHPAVITRFNDPAAGLEGVHNVWIDGNFVYASSTLLCVIDISNPAVPRVVASFAGGEGFAHDTYVRNGLAFVSKWEDGLVILDVGNGIRGGSPQEPVEVSRIELDGFTHNAWYWPEAGYVFVGREAVYDGTPPYGLMHIIDVRDLANPTRAATYRVNGNEPHNFWLDEERGIIYAAWYEQGVRAVDVRGELLGELDRQGREIAFSVYNGGGGCAAGSGATGTCTWAPQLHGGLVWVSDMNQGILALRPDF
jgi:hypothetical protein